MDSLSSALSTAALETQTKLPSSHNIQENSIKRSDASIEDRIQIRTDATIVIPYLIDDHNDGKLPLYIYIYIYIYII